MPSTKLAPIPEGSSALRTYTYAGLSFFASPALYNSRTVLFPFSSSTGTTVVGNLQSIDMAAGTVNWTFTAGNAFFCTPALAGNSVYIGNKDGNLYAVDLSTGNSQGAVELGAEPSPSPVYDSSTGLVFAGTVDGKLVAVDTASNTVRWSYSYPHASAGYTQVNVAVYDKVLYACFSVNRGGVFVLLAAFEPADGSLLWSVTLDAPVLAGLAFGDALAYVGCQDGSLRAIDLASHDEIWRFKTGGIILGQSAYDNGWVYFGSEDGNFYAHASRPKPLTISQWTVAVNYDIPTGVLVNDGNAFFGARDSNGNGYFYALDLASAQNGQPVALTEPLSGQLLFTPAVNDGWIAFVAQGLWGGEILTIDLGVLESSGPAPAMFAHPPRLTAADPAVAQGMLQQVSFASTLVVDDYDVSGTAATPRTPAFQMNLTLSDSQQAPRPAAKVSVWAAEAMTVEVDGRNVPLGTNSQDPAVLSANNSGQVFITGKGNISTGNLFLHPDFFLPGFYVTVFPDNENLNRLSTIQAGDLAPEKAVGYNGQPVLKSNYQDQTSRTNLASAIRNGIGRLPSSASALAISGAAGAPATRPFQPGEVPSWQVQFSDDSLSFSPLSSDQIQALFGGPQGPGEFWKAGSIFGDFADFINDCVNGVVYVGEVVWHFLEGVAGVIVRTAEKVYKFVVETVEEAVKVMTAIIKRAVTLVEHFVEFLSYLFDWSAIVATHKLIENHTISALNTMKNWIDKEIAAVDADVNAFFAAREQDVENRFNAIIAALTGQTVQSIRTNAGDPHAPFRAKGQDTTVQSHWLVRKLNTNAGKAPMAAAPDSGLSGGYIESIKTFFSNVRQQMAQDPNVQRLPEDLKNALHQFADLFTGEGFLGQTLASVLAVIRDVVAALIRLCAIAVDAFLKLLQSILDSIIKFFTAPIDIPFLSGLYKLIVGDDLSLLSLFSLIVAVPTTIVYEIITGSKPADRPALLGAKGPEWLGLANTFDLLLLLPLWIGADLAEFPPILSGAIAAASAIGSALTFALITVNDPSVSDYILWLVQLFSTVIAIFGIGVGAADQVAWAAAAPLIYCGYGFAMIALFTVYADIDPKKYWDPEAKTWVANIFSVLPYLGQPLSYIEGVGTAAVCVVDAVGFGVSAGLNTILYWPDPGSA